MRGDLAFFTGALSFLSGVVYASYGLSVIGAIIPAAFVFAALFATRINFKIAVCAALLLVTGAFYYAHDAARYEEALAQVPSYGALHGTVATDPKRTADAQRLIVRTEYGKVAVTAEPEPLYSYGDALTIEGAIMAPSAYQKGQHVVGQLRNPDIAFEARGGNAALRFLFDLKHRAKDAYDRVLSPERSAFLYGIIFGANEYISPTFAEELEVSGLRFITAIDGLHMQIVILIIFGALATFLSRRAALIVTTILAFLFIALTGFTVSGIRAALMAFIAGLARETRRVYLPHNALALVALVLALINPRTLIFDVGFQLSFCAVIAIIYFLPVLRSLLRMSEEPGFLGWRESLLITLAVQIATAPIIMTQFQAFSLTSFIASILVVWMLPFILAAGLILWLVAFFYPLAYIVGIIAGAMTAYVALIVHIFAKAAVLFNPSLGFPGVALYYSALIALIYWHAYRYNEKASADGELVAQSEAPALVISAEAAAYEIREVK